MQTTDTFIGSQDYKIDLFHNDVNKFFLDLENSSFAFCGNKQRPNYLHWCVSQA